MSTITVTEEPPRSETVKQISFKSFVAALSSSDLVLIRDDESLDVTIATFVGWNNEGADDLDFAVCSDGWGDVTASLSSKLFRDGNMLRVAGEPVTLLLYKKENP